MGTGAARLLASPVCHVKGLQPFVRRCRSHRQRAVLGATAGARPGSCAEGPGARSALSAWAFGYQEGLGELAAVGPQ